MSEEQGVVIARAQRELIWIRTDRGLTAMVRVLPELGGELDLCQPVTISVDENGRPTGVTAVKR
jgi:hypothetical protein